MKSNLIQYICYCEKLPQLRPVLAQVNLKVVPEKHFMHRVWLVTWVGETIAGETIVGELVLLCPLASGRRGGGRDGAGLGRAPGARGLGRGGAGA